MSHSNLKTSTHNLVHSIMFDSPLDEKVVQDFGINSDAHLETLRQAVRHKGLDVQALNEVMGHGERITELMNRLGCNPDRLVFRTAWDEFCERWGRESRQGKQFNHESDRSKQLER